jgi:hypothetical protein
MKNEQTKQLMLFDRIEMSFASLEMNENTSFVPKGLFAVTNFFFLKVRNNFKPNM